MKDFVTDSAETLRLLDEVQSGNRKAFDELFDRHRPQLRQMIERRLDPRLRARFDPSDLVQETQLDAYRRLTDFLRRRPMSFRMWLRKTAYDRLSGVRRDHVKAARCTINRESQSPDQSSIMIANQLTVSSPSPSGEAAKQELVKILQHAVWQLDDIDREILLMRYEEKLSNREVAYLLEISPDAASKRHGRALLRLQTVLLENGFSESKL